jgi:REP element-mobilizing transposase RayT
LAQTVTRSGWRLHAYVLMSNHYHLLLETPQANLVRGMTWLQTTYTTRYNARHRKRGHVFAGRYKALAVDPGESGYFAALLNYVHLNPVRARIVAGAGGNGLLEYAWSSLPAYVLKRKRPSWLTVERGLASVGLSDTARDRKLYLNDLESRAREEEAESVNKEGKTVGAALQRGWYLGSEEFRDRLLALGSAALERHRSSGQNYHGPEMSDHGTARARGIIEEFLGQASMSLPTLKARRKSDPFKVEIAAAIRRATTVPLRWIAEELSMGTSMNVSRLTASPLR